jgi:hypothetical protein
MTQSTPEITAPAAASQRLEPPTKAALDAMKAAGAEVKIAHFAKVQMPDVQPGWSHSMTPMIVQGTKERQKPAIPRRLSEVLST